MGPLVAITAMVALGAVLAGWPVNPRDFFEWRREYGMRRNPPGVRFELCTANGKHRFLIGETIPLVMRYSSSVPNKYLLDSSTYDRRGRMPCDSFDLDSNGGYADPIEDYFYSGVIDYLVGGHSPHAVLAREPVTISADLNEWVRFDRPGRYRVAARSGSAVRGREPSNDREPRLSK